MERAKLAHIDTLPKLVRTAVNALKKVTDAPNHVIDPESYHIGQFGNHNAGCSLNIAGAVRVLYMGQGANASKPLDQLTVADADKHKLYLLDKLRCGHSFRAECTALGWPTDWKVLAWHYHRAHTKDSALLLRSDLDAWERLANHIETEEKHFHDNVWTNNPV